MELSNLDNLLLANPAPCFLLGSNGEITWNNVRFLEFLKIDNQEQFETKSNLREYTLATDAETIGILLEKIERNKVSEAEKLYLTFCDGKGSRMPAEVSLVKVDLVNVNELLIFLENISVIDQFETQLSVADSFYYDQIFRLPIPVLRKKINPDYNVGGHHTFTDVNQEFCDRVGLSREEIVGKSDHDLFNETLAKQYQLDDTLVAEGERSIETIELHNHDTKTGAPYSVHVIKIPIFENGVVVEVLGFFWRVDERGVVLESILREVKNYRSLLKSLVENIPFNLYRKDEQGRITFATDKWCEHIGLPLGSVIGRKDSDLFEAELAEKYEADDLQVRLTGQPFKGSEPHTTADGKEMYVYVVKTQLRRPDGSVEGLQGIFLDVTVQRGEREKLKLAVEKYEETQKQLRYAQNRLVDLADKLAINAVSSAIMHDFRTPLNTIVLTTDRILRFLEQGDGGDVSSVRADVELIVSACQAERGRIEEILRVSQGGDVELELVNLGSCVRGWVADALGAAGEWDGVEFAISSNLPVVECNIVLFPISTLR